MVSVAEMRKQRVIMPEECTMSKVMASAATESGRRTAFLPPRSSLAVSCTGCCKKLLGQLDIGAASVKPNAWVDNMRASSPTHVRAAAALSSSFAAAAAAAAAAPRDEDCESWERQHPSALVKFDEVVAASEGKRIVMFLDYDGTLSPIVDDPDLAVMSDAMRETVRNAARHFPTAIVSGRCRDKVFSFVQLRELYYAGSHGMDIRGPSKATKHTESKAKDVFFQPASEFLPMMDEVYKALEEKTKSIPGSRVENNTFSLSVHFRCVEEKKWSSLAERVRSVLKDYPKLRVTLGRKVLEVRPSIKWDKGKALEFLLESLGFADHDSVFPIYIGDDRTDEDAFKVLRERGQGIGILVSELAKETNASYSLREPSEVREFLNRLVEWKRHSSKN